MGRYYAMFPPRFAFDAVRNLTSPGDRILDPFCGRGNAPFTASVMGRPAIGVDINPVAWLFTATKLSPDNSVDRVIRRLYEISKAARKSDRKSRSAFETMAWSPTIRAFLKSARRELAWKSSIADRTLMAFIALHMQDKKGAGLSNGLWPTIACSPSYAVKWWTENSSTRPPDIDPVLLLEDKIRRRYACGTLDQEHSEAFLGDAADVLGRRKSYGAKLLITSPPYHGVTDYWNDHWIRLWILGHSMHNDWKRGERFFNRTRYSGMLDSVFTQCKKHLKEDAIILVRSDRRPHTSNPCKESLLKVWPKRVLYVQESDAPHQGVSKHHGRGGSKSREFDFLLLGDVGFEWVDRAGFRRIS